MKKVFRLKGTYASGYKGYVSELVFHSRQEAEDYVNAKAKAFQRYTDVTPVEEERVKGKDCQCADRLKTLCTPQQLGQIGQIKIGDGKVTVRTYTGWALELTGEGCKLTAPFASSIKGDALSVFATLLGHREEILRRSK